MEMLGKGGYGGGGGGGYKGGGKGGSKGWNNKKKVDGETSVWIGNLSGVEATKDSSKALCEHMKQGGDCKWAEVSKKGTGVACYKSAQDATKAVMTMNGSFFNGVIIQVDSWIKQEKTEGEKQ